MKLNFANLEIELDSPSSEKEILDLIKILKIKSFDVSIKLPNDVGFYVIKGTNTKTLLDSLEAMMRGKNKKEKTKNGKKAINGRI